MASSTKNARKSVRDIAYYRQRFKNRVHSKLVSFLTKCAQEDEITQKDIAERLDRDPGQISRWLREPSNLTLDTISDLLLAVDADADPPEMVRFKDRAPANYVHPLIARVLNIDATSKQTSGSTSMNRRIMPLVSGIDNQPPPKPQIFSGITSETATKAAP
jgi:transcriptional regulator with XRE-family HTH domain